MHEFHIVTLGILEKDGELLLVQEGKEHVRGQWDLPGGSMKDGETFEKCLKREMKEETGYRVTPEKLVNFYWEKSVRTGRSVLVALYKCSIEENGSPSREEEILDRQFFKKEEINGLEIRKDNRRKMLEDYRNGKEVEENPIVDTRG